MGNRWLRDRLKQGAVTVMTAVDAFPTRATAKDDLAALIRSLRPVKVPGELIRLGPAGDGGYLLPDDLGDVVACYSPGVGGIIGFEEACADRGMRVYMADGSVESPVVGRADMQFVKKFVGAFSDEACMTMEEWIDSTGMGHGGDLILQIDIEGSEYETILSMSASLLRRFRIVAAEFHDLDQLWSRSFYSIASRAFQKILQSHACVHIHPNNCAKPVERGGLSIPPVMEFTFWRRDRVSGGEMAHAFPHPLDADNVAGPGFALPPCWYGAAQD